MLKFYYITDMSTAGLYKDHRILIQIDGRNIICATPTKPTAYPYSISNFALMEVDINTSWYQKLKPHLPKFVKNILQIQN